VGLREQTGVLTCVPPRNSSPTWVAFLDALWGRGLMSFDVRPFGFAVVTPCMPYDVRATISVSVPFVSVGSLDCEVAGETLARLGDAFEACMAHTPRARG
jgi:hypothetical protein